MIDENESSDTPSGNMELQQLSQVWAKAVRDKDARKIRELRKMPPPVPGLRQEEVYGEAHQVLGEGIAELEQMAQNIETSPGAPLPEELSGAFILRKHFDTEIMKALPPSFGEVKNRVCHAVIRICKVIYKSENGIALGLVNYCLGIAPEGDTKKLLTQIRDRIRSHRPDSGIAEKSRSGIPTGVAVLLVILSTIVIFAVWRVVSWVNTINSRNKEIVEMQESYEQDAVLKLREKAVMDSIARSDVGDLSAPHGLAPLKRCLTPRPRLSGTQRKLLIKGDDNFDAILFLFNGDRNVDQIFVAAGKSIQWGGLVEGSPISTLIIFGKGWDPKLENPCDEPGWFRQDVTYAGFASYATDPYPIEFSEGHTGFQVKRGRLYKTRELSAARFYELFHEFR